MLVAVSAAAMAQSNVDALMKRLERSNQDINNPKKADRPATWINRGEIYRQLGDANVSQLFVGQPANLMVSAMGNPLNADAIPVVKIGNEEYQKYDYPNVVVYLAPDNTVAMYEEKTPAFEGAFQKSIESYDKALQLDPNNQRNKDNVNAGLNTVVTSLLVKANNEFLLKEYAKAYDTYAMAAKLQDQMNDPRSSEVYFQMAVCAIMAMDYQKANTALDVLLAKKDYRDGAVLYYAGVVKSEIPEEYGHAEEIFKQGIQMYPDNSDMLNGLINLYIKKGESPDKIIPIIKQAQQKDPNNPNLILQEGNAYIAMDDYDNAIKAYDAAIAADPAFFNAVYNKGFAYYKLADQAYKELNDMDYTNVSATKAKNDEVLNYRKQAIEVLEQAYVMDNSNKSVVELLKALSFSMRDEDPKYLEMYEKFNEINKNLQ